MPPELDRELPSFTVEYALPGLEMGLIGDFILTSSRDPLVRRFFYGG
jgi:hypothetical protein